ncbi:MAG TPA: hypothetical protein VNM87_05275 [Candidatus Udaeobacter sp.]|nr:hypothetical protein [Candidatus Udaeobacter sp.]
MRRQHWLRLALAAEVLLFLVHGAVLGVRAPWPDGSLASGNAFEAALAGLAKVGLGSRAAIPFLGAVAGSAAIILTAALAAGVEGLRPLALVPSLLPAASPVFAHAAFTGGEEVVFASLLLATAYRAFTETHTAGRLPVSALFGGLAGACGRGGVWTLVAFAAQRVAFVRKFQLPRAVAVFAGVWLILSLALTFVLMFLLAGAGHGPASGATLRFAMRAGGLGVGLWRVLGGLMQAVNGLALLPFVLALVLAWKPKEVYFRVTLAVAALIPLLLNAALAPAAGFGRVLAPALPFAFLIAGDALGTADLALESGGLRGRTRLFLGWTFIAALALAELAPTLAASMD